MSRRRVTYQKLEGLDTRRLKLELTRTETLDGGVVWLTYLRTYD